jgi:hypothetical protein
MDNEISQAFELKHMREHIHQSVNALEVCWACERICECEQWLINQAVPVWLCLECVTQIQGDQISKLSLAAPKPDQSDKPTEPAPGNPLE